MIRRLLFAVGCLVTGFGALLMGAPPFLYMLVRLTVWGMTR